MANLARVRINWTGGIGLPGFTILHFRNSTPGIINQTVVNNAVTKTDAFIGGILSAVSSAVTLTVDSTVTEIDETTGAIVSFWTATPAAGRVGTGTTTYSAPVGAVVNWKTSAVHQGRLLRGRSFLVPLEANAYDVNGTIGGTRLTALNTAADTMIAATGDARLVVWGRPRPEEAGPPVVPAVDGVSAEVTDANVPDKAAILSSRRD